MGRPEKYSNLCNSKNLSEDDFFNSWQERLEKYFYIKKEVPGIHLSGKTMKIDAVITPKDTTDWKNKEIAFGVEFKSPAKLDRLHSQFNFMKQCVDYSYTNFKDYGYIPILGCPAFEVDETYSDVKALSGYRRFLNSFAIGELCQTHKGLTIIFAEQYIWHEGIVDSGKRWSFEKNFGSK